MQDIVSQVRGILSPVGLESYPFKVSIFFNKPHNTFIRGCFVDGQGCLKVEMIAIFCMKLTHISECRQKYELCVVKM